MPETVIYRFHEKGGIEITVELNFDSETYRVLIPQTASRPSWTELGFQKCSNCPLDGSVTHCPAAATLAHFIPSFAHEISHEKAVVQVETGNRTCISKTTLQSGMASLMGLALATSGCPRTAFLRPMARFHLPFADERETVFRSLSAWLLTEYIRADGKVEKLSFDGLKNAYRELSTVNAALAERMRSVVSKDAALNAVIILDTFALIAPENVEYGFEDIKSIMVTE